MGMRNGLRCAMLVVVLLVSVGVAGTARDEKTGLPQGAGLAARYPGDRGTARSYGGADRRLGRCRREWQ